MSDAYPGELMPHEDFEARFIRTLAPEGIAFHAQLFPGIYGTDGARHDEIRRNPAGADSGLPILEKFLQKAAAQKIRADRLRILPAVGQNGYDEINIRTMIMTFSRAGALGENTRFAWYNKQIDRLISACGPESPYVLNYQSGSERNVPRGSFWLAREAGSTALKAVRTMNYANNKAKDYGLESMVYMPPFDPALEEYVNFWRGVFEDRQQHLTLAQALTLDPAYYPSV